jgi:hypothetical protein
MKLARILAASSSSSRLRWLRGRAKYNAKKDITAHEIGGCTYHGERG